MGVTRPCGEDTLLSFVSLSPRQGKEIYITHGTRTGERTRCARLPSLHCLPLCLSFCSAHSHTYTGASPPSHNICIFLWLCTRQQAMMAAARLALLCYYQQQQTARTIHAAMLLGAAFCSLNMQSILACSYGNILLSGELYLSLSWIFSSKMWARSLLQLDAQRTNPSTLSPGERERRIKCHSPMAVSYFCSAPRFSPNALADEANALPRKSFEVLSAQTILEDDVSPSLELFYLQTVEIKILQSNFSYHW